MKTHDGRIQDNKSLYRAYTAKSGILLLMNSQLTVSLQQLSVNKLTGVGPAIVDKLAKLAIYTVQDILFYLPLRYQDRTCITPLRDVRAGHYAVIEGKVISSQVKFGKRRQLVVQVSDGSARIELRFFYFNTQQKNSFKPDLTLRCFGEVRFWQNNYSLIHPEYRFLNQHTALAVEASFTPIYPTIEGLSQLKWRQLSSQALTYLNSHAALMEYLPEFVLKKFDWLPLTQALQYVHRPPPDASIELLNAGHHPAQQRLAFEELLAHHLSMRRARAQYQQHSAVILSSALSNTQLFLANLGFTLTAAQAMVWQEIVSDLAMAKPMLRLVQGDVGCGKTVLAALAALCAVQHHSQVVLMAPTELLAEQHFQQFQRWFTPLNIRVDFLAAKLTAKLRRQVLENIALGISQIVVGTHALFQQTVHFKQLALIIVDEQHRFGVHQRLSLRAKGASENSYPHQLTMTATPIPRTLAMVGYADLDISVIDALPPGRTPVKTLLLSSQRRNEIIARVRQLCIAGGQVYWVCPLIAESDLLQCEAAETTFDYLREQLPDLCIGLMHGRLKGQAKQEIMAAFKQRQINVLVATTVIEVGVDVPNATLMVIENSERLGLAQLHQLRGRVGRGSKHSYCVLLYQLPLSHTAKDRLAVMRATQDGFIIAQKDLELRGAGEVLGTRQTGAQGYRIANFWRDQALLPKVKQTAQWLEAQAPEHAKLLIKRWIGSNEQFIHV